MKKYIAFMILVVFVMANMAFARDMTKGNSAVKTKTKITKISKVKAGKTMVKSGTKMTEKKEVKAGEKPVKRSFLGRVWHKLFGWMKRPAGPNKTEAPKK